MPTNTEQEFKVITGEKDDTIIVLLLGQIRSQEIPKLEELEKFLLEKPLHSVIISFRDVAQFLPATHATWAKVQETLRKAGKLITLCSFKPDIKAKLIQAGIIMESETFNNIPDSWKALKTRLNDPQASATAEVSEKKAA